MIRVHRIPFSTNVERVALAAGHKRLELEWADHDPGDRGAVMELSGQPLVPVAEIDDEVVRGSMRIVERLEAIRPDPPLIPADPAAAARARVFAAWFDRVWKGPVNALDADEPPRDADALGARARKWTRWCDGLLDHDPYLGGESPGLADVCAFPFLKYATIDPEPGDEDRFHRVLVELLRADEHPRLKAWIARVDELPRA